MTASVRGPVRTRLAAFALDLAALQRAADAGDPMAVGLVAQRASAIVLEWLQAADGTSLVALCGGDAGRPQAPRVPLLAWGDRPAANDLARGAGWQAIDACLVAAGDGLGLSIEAEQFLAPTPEAPAALGPAWQLTLDWPGAPAPAATALASAAPAATALPSAPLAPAPGPTAAAALAPDPVEPAAGWLALDTPDAGWVGDTGDVDGRSVRLQLARARYPAVADWLVGQRLDAADGRGAAVEARALWARSATRPAWPAPAARGPALLPPGARRLPADGVFGPPDFRFDDVEVIGFRLDLSARHGGRADLAREALQSLIDPPLNFHLHERRDSRGLPADFAYRVATPVVIIELLRYGAMRSVSPQPPLRGDDAMPQHELLVRLLVGRVDDDSAQARDAASHCAAIFVDNAWSRAVGRAALGYPKTLAWIGAGREGPLLDARGVPRAAAAGTPAVPLHEVGRIGRFEDMARPGRAQDTLLDLEYPGVRFDETWLPFNLGWLGGARGVWPGWQRDDFDAPHFRRGFARRVVGAAHASLGVVQVTPCDGQPLPRAWVSADSQLRALRTQFPRGVASLTLHRAGLPAEHPWTRLVEMLGARGDRSVQLGLPTGDWYRLRCGMDYRGRNR